MKKTYIRCIAMVLVIAAIFAFSVPAVAEYDDSDEPHRASAYISYVYAHASKSGNTVSIYFAITGTGPMTSLGATDIFIVDSSNYPVALLDSTNTSGLMGYNRGYYSNTVTWSGATPGEHYYAIVGYKAENSYGYDTTAYTTNWTT